MIKLLLSKTFIASLSLLLFAFSPQLLALESFPKQGSYLVAFSQDTLKNDWRLAQIKAVAKGLSSYKNIKFIFRDAAASNKKQIKDIKELVAQKAQVLVVSAHDSKALASTISWAHKRGVKVILLDRQVNSSDYTSFIGADNYKIGLAVANYLKKQNKGKRNILLLEGLDQVVPTLERTKGFLDGIKGDKNLNVVAKLRGNYLRKDAAVAMQQLYAQNTKFDVIFSHSDSMLMAAIKVMKQEKDPIKGKTLIGVDYIASAKQAILAGEQEASILYPTGGKAVIPYILKLLQGKKVPKKINLPFVFVTKKNANAVRPVF